MKNTTMNYSRKMMMLALVALLATANSYAQKFGHINSQQLLLDSPSIKQADTELETYQTNLVKKGTDMVTAFEADYQKYVADREAGNLSQIQIQQIESGLQATQQAIQKYEVEVQQKLAVKREELYKPILDRVKNVMDEMGKSEGFTMIFDTSTNGLLFAVEGEDLLAKVKAKLGW